MADNRPTDQSPAPATPPRPQGRPFDINRLVAKAEPDLETTEPKKPAWMPAKVHAWLEAIQQPRLLAVTATGALLLGAMAGAGVVWAVGPLAPSQTGTAVTDPNNPPTDVDVASAALPRVQVRPGERVLLVWTMEETDAGDGLLVEAGTVAMSVDLDLKPNAAEYAIPDGVPLTFRAFRDRRGDGVRFRYAIVGQGAVEEKGEALLVR